MSSNYTEQSQAMIHLQNVALFNHTGQTLMIHVQKEKSELFVFSYMQY